MSNNMTPHNLVIILKKVVLGVRGHYYIDF